jgi:hypothetical protein
MGRVGHKWRGKKKTTGSGHRERMIFFNRICCDTNCEGGKKATAADTEETEERMLYFFYFFLYLELAADINHAFSA